MVKNRTKRKKERAQSPSALASAVTSDHEASSSTLFSAAKTSSLASAATASALASAATTSPRVIIEQSPEARSLGSTHAQTGKCDNPQCHRTASYEVVYKDDNNEDTFAAICKECRQDNPKTFQTHLIVEINHISDSSSDESATSPSLQAYQDLPTGTIASYISGTNLPSALAVVQERTASCESPFCTFNSPITCLITYSTLENDKTIQQMDYLCADCEELYSNAPTYKGSETFSFSKLITIIPRKPDIVQIMSQQCEALHCISNLPASFLLKYKEDETEQEEFLCEACKETLETSPTGITVTSCYRLSSQNPSSLEATQSPSLPAAINPSSPEGSLEVTQNPEIVTMVTQNSEKATQDTQTSGMEICVTEPQTDTLKPNVSVHSSNSDDFLEAYEEDEDMQEGENSRKEGNLTPLSGLPSTPQTPKFTARSLIYISPEHMQMTPWKMPDFQNWYNSDFAKDKIPEDFAEAFKQQCGFELATYEFYSDAIATWKAKHICFCNKHDLFGSETAQAWISVNCPSTDIPPLIRQVWQLEINHPLVPENTQQYTEDLQTLAKAYPEFFLPILQIHHTTPENMVMDFDHWSKILFDEWKPYRFVPEKAPRFFHESFKAQCNINLDEVKNYDETLNVWKSLYYQFNSVGEILGSNVTTKWIETGCSSKDIPPMVKALWAKEMGRPIRFKNNLEYMCDLQTLAQTYQEYFAVAVHEINTTVTELKGKASQKQPPKPETSKQPTKKVSYAGALSSSPTYTTGSESPDLTQGTNVPPLKDTYCRINKRTLEGRRPPVSDQSYTLWWDLKDIAIPQSVIKARLLSMDEIVGWSFRENQDWVELAYEVTKVRDQALTEDVSFAGYTDIIKPVKARRIGGSEVFIQLANVPQNRKVEYQIREIFAQFGYLADLAPVLYTGSDDKWSCRWNLILNIPEGSYLAVPSIIHLFGHEVCVFWQGCPSVCSICFSEGHFSQHCSDAFRRKAYKKKMAALIPAPIISNSRQKVIEEAQAMVAEQNITLTDALATIADNRGKLGDNAAASLLATARSLEEAAKVTSKALDQQIVEAFQAEEEEVFLTQKQATRQAQIMLANQGFAELPPAEDDFVEVKSRRQIQREKKQQKDPKPTPKAPRPSTPTQSKRNSPSTPTTPSRTREQKRQRKEQKRTKVTQDICCAYFHRILSRPKKPVEQIWNMSPSQYVEFREKLEANLYHKMADWERRRPVDFSFDPKDIGIESERGRSPSPPPVTPEASTSGTSHPKTPTKGKLFRKNADNPLLINPAAKLKVENPKQEINIAVTVEDERQPGRIIELPIRMEMGRKIGALKEVVFGKLGRKDFFFLNQGFRLAHNEYIGERLRNNSKVLVVGAWNTTDPQVASKARAKKVDNQKTKTIRLRISAPERNRELAADFEENTLGLAIQEFVATALKMEPYQPIVVHRGNVIANDRTLKDQKIDGTTKLTLSSNVNFFITVQYKTLKELGATTNIIIPNNKNVFETKAACVRHIQILKGQEFDLLDHKGEVMNDDAMINTKVRDRGIIGIYLKDGQAVDALDDDGMDVDIPPEGHLTVRYNDKKDSFDLKFDPKNKTGADLHKAIKETLSQKGLGDKEFVIKHNFHILSLKEPLDHWEQPYYAAEIQWGSTYTYGSNIATIIE